MIRGTIISVIVGAVWIVGAALLLTRDRPAAEPQVMVPTESQASESSTAEESRSCYAVRDIRRAEKISALEQSVINTAVLSVEVFTGGRARLVQSESSGASFSSIDEFMAQQGSDPDTRVDEEAIEALKAQAYRVSPLDWGDRLGVVPFTSGIKLEEQTIGGKQLMVAEFPPLSIASPEQLDGLEKAARGQGDMVLVDSPGVSVIRVSRVGFSCSLRQALVLVTTSDLSGGNTDLHHIGLRLTGGSWLVTSSWVQHLQT